MNARYGEKTFNTFLTKFTVSLFQNKNTFRNSIREISDYFSLRGLILFIQDKPPAYRIFSGGRESGENRAYNFVYFDRLLEEEIAYYIDKEAVLGEYAAESNLITDLDLRNPYFIPLKNASISGFIIADTLEEKSFSADAANALESVCSILISGLTFVNKKLPAFPDNKHNIDANVSLIDAYPEGVFLTDLEGIIITSNETGAERLGSIKKEVIGKNICKDFKKYISDLRVEKFFATAKTGKPQHFDDEVDGRVFNSRLLPVHNNETGAMDRIAIISVDITEKRKMHVEKLLNESKFRIIFDQAPIGIAALEIYGKMSRMNRRFSEILGYNEDDWEAFSFSKLVHPGYAHYIEAELLKLVKNEIDGINEEIKMIRKNGSVACINLVISNAHAGSDYPPFLIVMIEDISERRTMRDALNLVQEKFRASADNMADGFAVYKAVRNASGVIIDFKCDYINRAGLKLYRKEREDVIGKNMLEVFPDRKETGLFDQYCYVVEENIPFVCQSLPVKYNYEDPNEKESYVNMKVFKMADGIAVIWEDVTEAKKAERELKESRSRYKALAHNFPNGSVLLFDREMHYVIADGTDILNESGENNVIGKTIYQLYAHEIWEILEPNYKAAFEGKSAMFDINYKDKIYEVQVKPIVGDDGVSEYGMALFQNITDIREFEGKLQKLNDDKDKFFSIIAHDLKNPFTALLGYTEILNDDFEQLSIEKLRMFSSSLHKSARSVYALLENLLQWSRLQTGRIDFHPARFMLRNVINQAVDVFNINAAKKDVQLIVSADPLIAVNADENMTETILRNLLSNAIKFTKEKGQVRISAMEEGSFVRVTVEDTGVGISESDIDKLFIIGKKVMPVGMEEEKGSGLGLILCKEFVEKNGGTITVESHEGKGTKFVFTLPLAY